MAEDLSEIKERLQHTKEKLHQLRDACALYNRESVEVRTRQYHGGHFDMTVEIKRPVPTGVKSDAGLIANELRACLDALACQLALRNGKTAVGTYFPISKSKEIFENDGYKKMKKMSQADQQIIVDLTPYRGGNSTLFALHEIDRTRKHQRLAAHVVQHSSMSVGGMHLPVGGSVYVTNGSFNGTPVDMLNYGRSMFPGPLLPGASKVIASGHGMTTSIRPGIGICYEEPEEIAGREIMSVLAEFGQTVESIVGRFD